MFVCIGSIYFPLVLLSSLDEGRSMYSVNVEYPLSLLRILSLSVFGVCSLSYFCLSP